VRFILVLTLLGAPALRAESAVLECIADGWVMVVRGDLGKLTGRSPVLELAPRRKEAVLDFRFSVIEGWQVTKVTLLLHLERGAAPPVLAATVAHARWREDDSEIPLPPFRAVGNNLVTKLQQGWVSVDIHPAVVQKLADRAGFGLWLTSPSVETAFHARESLHLAPYLIVEGRRHRAE